MNWAVLYPATDPWGAPPEHGVEAHVVPWEDDGIARGHHASATCWCSPRNAQEEPLSPAIWSHREPTWPGAWDRVA